MEMRKKWFGQPHFGQKKNLIFIIMSLFQRREFNRSGFDLQTC